MVSTTYWEKAHFVHAILTDTGLVYLELKEKIENVGEKYAFCLIYGNLSRRERHQKKLESLGLSNP